MIRSCLALLGMFLLFGCKSQLPVEKTALPFCTACPCPACPVPELPKPPAKPLQPARWDDLPGWRDADLARSFAAFRDSCAVLARQAAWAVPCAATREADPANLRAWFEAQFEPWQLVNPDGSREGLVTGYYEPILNGSRERRKPYVIPVFGPPDDLITVDLSSQYPELKSMRLRGRLEGRKLIPYFSRNEWSRQETQRKESPLLWVDDAIDFFFMQIQGSGQIRFADGSRTRLAYADQNGHPYRSIGKWLIDQGELKAEQASMAGIKAWAKAHPQRQQEMLNANPSLVFFRETRVEGSGPPGAMNLPLTPEVSIAVDPRHTPLGTPVWLATTQPLSNEPLRRLMLAQDTGGAIRGPVRADFFWGSGPAAGDKAGRMRQTGQMWALMPRNNAAMP